MNLFLFSVICGFSFEFCRGLWYFLKGSFWSFLGF